jgi:hypothetical protein
LGTGRIWAVATARWRLWQAPFVEPAAMKKGGNRNEVLSETKTGVAAPRAENF